MAIVKASYIKRIANSKDLAKAALRYIQHRPANKEERIIRALYGNDGVLERSEVYGMIDQAQKGDIFFRFIISPDPEIEDQYQDLNIRTITSLTMHTLQERLGKPVSWAASDHCDHTDVRHVHVIAILPRRLGVKDLTILRNQANQASLEQRQELDQLRLQRTRAREEAHWEQGL